MRVNSKRMLKLIYVQFPQPRGHEVITLIFFKQYLSGKQKYMYEFLNVVTHTHTHSIPGGRKGIFLFRKTCPLSHKMFNVMSSRLINTVQTNNETMQKLPSGWLHSGCHRKSRAYCW